MFVTLVPSVPIDPNSTLIAFSQIPLATYYPPVTSFEGVLANSDFTVGGATYSTTDLSWSTPQWSTEFTGILAMDVTATPISTPEPSSTVLVLKGVGLLGVSSVMRNRVPPGLHPQSLA